MLVNIVVQSHDAARDATWAKRPRLDVDEVIIKGNARVRRTLRDGRWDEGSAISTRQGFCASAWCEVVSVSGYLWWVRRGGRGTRTAQLRVGRVQDPLGRCV